MKRTGSFVTQVLGEVDVRLAALPPQASAPHVVSPDMRRTQSSPHLAGLDASAVVHHRTLERHIRALQRQVAAIHDRVSVFEATNARWGLRYTRRFALAGNLLVGGWIFSHRLLSFLRQRRAQLLQAMMPKIQLRASAPVSLGPLVSGAVRHSLRGGAWLFFACALLLSRNRSWNWLAGATVATAYAAYLSLIGVAASWPWAVVLSVCGNVSFLVANFNAQSSPELPAYPDLTMPDDAEDEE
jgi:hypothetical protein